MKTLFCTALLVLGSFSQLCLKATVQAAESADTQIPAGAVVPPWPKPATRGVSAQALRVHSRDLEVIHSPAVPGALEVRVAGELMALGQSSPMIGYVAGNGIRWLVLNSAAQATRKLNGPGKPVLVNLEGTDLNGALWGIRQQFSPGSIPGAVEIRTEVAVDQDRAVAFSAPADDLSRRRIFRRK